MLGKLLDRPVSVTMAALVFVILGCVGIFKLPVSLIPDLDVPYVTVQVNAGDMSAQELESTIVSNLRNSFVQLPDLKDMRSESRDASAVITLTFNEGCDIDYSFIEVNEKVDRAMSHLSKIERPKVFKASAADIPSFYINITLSEKLSVTAVRDSVLYPVSEEFLQMSDFARNVITRRLEQLPEVAMVDVTGLASSEILIIPSIDALRQMGISISQFESLVSSANVRLSNLTIRDGEYHYNVKFESFVKDKKDIEDAYFNFGDRVLQIKDIAQVVEHPASRTGLSLSDGEDAIVLAVVKQSGARMSELKKSINVCLNSFEKDYPQMEFLVTRDQTELLDYSIKNLLLNIIVAILLDCLIIFLFMKDFRSPFLVSLTIPVSLVMSFFIFYAIGLSINIISLSGLLLGVGMMVDNSIIVTDNITGRWLRGDTLREAVIDGTKEVSGPMLSSVLTTCAVFLPLIFLDGLAGEMFYDQAIAVTVVLLTSYLVTVILIPVYYWALYKKHNSFQPSRFLSRFEMKGAMNLYDSLVSFFLSHLWLSWVIPVFCIIMAAFAGIFIQKEKLPPVTYSDSVLNVDWNEHITIDENRGRTENLLSALDAFVEHTTSSVGVPQYVLNHGNEQTMSETSLYFKCEDAATLAHAKEEVMGFVRASYPAAFAYFSNSGNIFEMVFAQKEPQLMAHLRPLSRGELEVEPLQKTLSSLRSELPGIHIDEVPLKTDVLYVSDPRLMALYNVSFAELSAVLTNSLNGNRLFELVRGDERIPVMMGTDIRQMEEILSANFIEKDGYDIPLDALMKQTWERDIKTIVAGEEGVYYPLPLDVKSSQVQSVRSSVKKNVMDGGLFDVDFSGAYYSNLEMIRQMAFVLLIAIALLFLILASQFESLLQPAIILSEVVIDIAFCLIGLWVLGCSINLMSLIGMVVICGIVINDSILKIDTINRLVRSGTEMEQAIHEAGHKRLKAIIMTSLTTILAVAPFLSRGNMGADLQYPMALVIIIGMTIGTLVSLFYVPLVYAAIYGRRKNR